MATMATIAMDEVAYIVEVEGKNWMRCGRTNYSELAVAERSLANEQ